MKNDKPKLDLKTALGILHEARSCDESYFVEVCRNARQKYGISDKELSVLFLFAEMLEKMRILKNPNSNSNQKIKLPNKR